MQHCDFKDHCRLGGVIRPGQKTLITDDGIAHLACQINVIRQMEHKRDTEDLTPEEKRRLQVAIDYLERMSVRPDRTSTGSMRVPPAILTGDDPDGITDDHEAVSAGQYGSVTSSSPAWRHRPNLN